MIRLKNLVLLAFTMILMILASCSRDEPEREGGRGGNRPPVRSTTGNTARPHRSPSIELVNEDCE